MTDFKDFWIRVGQPGAYSQNMSYGQPFGLDDIYGIKIKHAPMSLMPKIKNVVSQSWKDEDGDDAWMPMNASSEPAIVHEAVDYQPTFVIYYRADDDGDKKFANDAVTSLIKRIEGRWLQMSDDYTQIGYDGAYLVDVDDDPKFKRREGYEYMEFWLKFRINGTNVIAPFKGTTSK